MKNNTNTIRTAVEIDGTTYIAELSEPRPYSGDRGYSRKPFRLFIDGIDLDGRPPYDHEVAEQLGARIGLYVDHHGPHHPGWEAHDKAWKRYNNREKVAHKAVASQLFPEAGKVRFSQYCGCTTCSCSPGVFVEDIGWERLGKASWVRLKTQAQLNAEASGEAAKIKEEAIIAEAAVLAFV